MLSSHSYKRQKWIMDKTKRQDRLREQKILIHHHKNKQFARKAQQSQQKQTEQS